MQHKVPYIFKIFSKIYIFICLTDIYKDNFFENIFVWKKFFEIRMDKAKKKAVRKRTAFYKFIVFFSLFSIILEEVTDS
jgi:hypothetical protein